MSKRTPRRRAAGWMHVMLILLALISLLPIYLVALNSFKSHDVIYKGWITPPKITS